MPRRSSLQSLDPIRQQLGRVRRRHNLHETQRGLYLVVGTLGMASTAVVLLALWGSAWGFAAGGAATILGALVFQYGLGLAPCPLCLEQRIPYYVAIPLAVVVAIAALRGAPRPLVQAGLGLIALAMLFGAGLALYHAGIEWKWWPGPQDCSGPLTPLGSRGLLEQLQSVNVVRCDEAPWRFERGLGWRFEHRPGAWSPFYLWWWVDGRVVLLPAPPSGSTPPVPPPPPPG